MSTDPRLRVSDADRERAMADLAAHYAEGRLDHEEYDERLDAIGTARTRADLAVVFSDLPRLAPTPTPPARAERRRPGPRVPLVPVLALVIGLAILLKAPWLVLVIGLAILWSRRRACPAPAGRRHGHADYRRPRRSHGW